MYRYKETILNKSSSDTGIRPLDLNVPLPDLSPLGRYNESEDAEDKHYLNHVATAGGMVNRTQQPNTIVWKILKHSKLLELEVIDSNGSYGRTRKIRIHSPLAFRKDCVTVVDDSDAIVVDFITTNGFLYTLRISAEEFLASWGTRTKLRNSNSSDWRSIKSPYSFDMKPPQLMHAINANTLIVALQEGTIIRFDRKSALDVINLSQFQDQHSMSFSRLLPWNHSDKVPGRSDVSIRAVVSMDHSHSSNQLVTVSINRQLRVWDLETNTVLHEQDLAMGKEQLLDPNASKIVTYSGNDFILSYVPLEDGKFKIWSNELELLQDIDAVMPDNTAVWIVADLKLVQKSGTSKGSELLQLWVVWKSDTSSCVQTLEISNKDQSGWISSIAGEIGMESKFAKVDSQDESEYFIKKIFGPGGVSLETLKTALPIYAQHFGLTFEQPELTNMKRLRQAVCQTVGAAVSMSSDSYGNNDYQAYNQDLTLQWTRFERLCNELEKQGHEALALGVVSSGSSGSVCVIKSSFISIVRDMSKLEMVYYNRSTSPSSQVTKNVAAYIKESNENSESLLKFFDILYTFHRGISYAVLAGLHCTLREDYMRVRHNFATSERVVEYYEEHFAPHLTDYAIGVLVTQLAEIEQIDTVLTLVNSLVENETKSGNTVVANESGGNVSSYGSQLLCKELYEHGKIARDVTLDVLSLIVISSCNDDLVQEDTTAFARHLAQLRAVSCILDVLRICEDNPTAENNSMQTFMELLVIDGNMNSMNQLWTQLTTPTAPAQLAVQLHQRGYSLSTCRDFITEFVPCDYFGAFVRGVLAVEERWICKAACGVSAPNSLSSTQRAIATKLDPNISLEQGLASYYESVARHVVSVKPMLALRLVKIAVQMGGDVQTFSSWFDIALMSRSFDDAYTALIELDCIENNEVDCTSKIDKLVDAMVEGGSAERLCSYPFIGMKQTVAACLEKRGDFKVLYAWKVEHGDYRGAAAAIYAEAQRLRAVDSLGNFDKVRATYETALNALHAIPDSEDRWIVVDDVLPDVENGDAEKTKRIKTGDTQGYRQGRSALKYGDVMSEYTRFVSGLEGQLTQLVL